MCGVHLCILGLFCYSGCGSRKENHPQLQAIGLTRLRNETLMMTRSPSVLHDGFAFHFLSNRDPRRSNAVECAVWCQQRYIQAKHPPLCLLQVFYMMVCLFFLNIQDIKIDQWPFLHIFVSKIRFTYLYLSPCRFGWLPPTLSACNKSWYSSGAELNPWLGRPWKPRFVAGVNRIESLNVSKKEPLEQSLRIR